MRLLVSLPDVPTAILPFIAQQNNHVNQAILVLGLFQCLRCYQAALLHKLTSSLFYPHFSPRLQRLHRSPMRDTFVCFAVMTFALLAVAEAQMTIIKP